MMLSFYIVVTRRVYCAVQCSQPLGSSHIPIFLLAFLDLHFILQVQYGDETIVL